MFVSSTGAIEKVSNNLPNLLLMLQLLEEPVGSENILRILVNTDQVVHQPADQPLLLDPLQPGQQLTRREEGAIQLPAEDNNGRCQHSRSPVARSQRHGET